MLLPLGPDDPDGRCLPPAQLQQTLGYTSIATTGQYTHARPNDSSSRYLVG